MTSNVGTRQLKDFGKGVGFATPSSENDSSHTNSVLQKALNRTFAPEFLNRVDDVVIFDQLSKESIFQIIDIELNVLLKRVENLGFKLIISPEAKEFIATKGYDVEYGARPLKRAIQKYIEDELSEILITSTVKQGQTIQLALDKENEKIISEVTN